MLPRLLLLTLINTVCSSPVLLVSTFTVQQSLSPQSSEPAQSSGGQLALSVSTSDDQGGAQCQLSGVHVRWHVVRVQSRQCHSSCPWLCCRNGTLTTSFLSSLGVDACDDQPL